MSNFIDINKLPVTEGKQNDTYIGISQEGGVIRTTIEMSGDVDLEGYATEDWVNSKDYATKDYVNDAISNIDIPEGGGTSTDAGTYILECVQGVDYSEWWLNPETYEMEWIIEKFLEYNQDEELKNHNKEVIDAILAGKCKTLYYKFRYFNNEVLLETDENGREHRKAVNYYNYIPMSWNEWDLTNGEKYITFSGKHKNEVQSNPIEYSFTLNKASGSKKNESENQYFTGNVLQYYPVFSGNGYLLNRDSAAYAAGNDKPVYIDILDENGAARTLLSGKYEVVKDTEYIYAWCIDENANFYLWTFKAGIQETTATITDLKSTPVDLTPYYTKKEIDQLLADLDLTDYYTKAETDELIANINLGDGETISSIVSTEVSNQLADNFKTINGESIIGEGDITIEGGGSDNVVFDATVSGDATYIKRKVLEDCYINRKVLLSKVDKQIVQVNVGAEYDTDGNLTKYTGKAVLDENTMVEWEVSATETSAAGSKKPLDGSVALFEYPQDYTIGTRTYDKNTYDLISVDTQNFDYSTDGRQEYNKKLIDKFREGKIKTIYIKHYLELAEKTLSSDETTITNVEVINWIYVPMAYRDLEWDGYLRLMGVYNNNEYSYNPVGLSCMLNEIADCLSYNQTAGSSGGFDGGDVYGDTHFYGMVQFDNELQMRSSNSDGYTDIASGIACAFKTDKGMAEDMWVMNFHQPTTKEPIRFTTYEEEGWKSLGAIDEQGIYEGDVLLRDKYMLREDTTRVLTTDLEYIDYEILRNAYENGYMIYAKYDATTDGGDSRYMLRIPLTINKAGAEWYEAFGFINRTTTLTVSAKSDMGKGEADIQIITE